MITCAEGLSADDQAVLLVDLEGLAAELSDVSIARVDHYEFAAYDPAIASSTSATMRSGDSMW